jgi:hypothetical protein
LIFNALLAAFSRSTTPDQIVQNLPVTVTEESQLQAQGDAASAQATQEHANG